MPTPRTNCSCDHVFLGRRRVNPHRFSCRVNDLYLVCWKNIGNSSVNLSRSSILKDLPSTDHDTVPLHSGFSVACSSIKKRRYGNLRLLDLSTIDAGITSPFSDKLLPDPHFGNGRDEVSSPVRIFPLAAAAAVFLSGVDPPISLSTEASFTLPETLPYPKVAGPFIFPSNNSDPPPLPASLPQPLVSCMWTLSPAKGSLDLPSSSTSSPSSLLQYAPFNDDGLFSPTAPCFSTSFRLNMTIFTAAAKSFSEYLLSDLWRRSGG
mmetsp:Transcript_56556/g.120118  ORF Transcript_56556/g.120118 Transcript_56556/m.120118 type:complete len:264 (-) Transcript_56556:1839-2630(-)